MEAIELYKEETAKMSEEGDGKQKVFIVCIHSRITQPLISFLVNHNMIFKQCKAMQNHATKRGKIRVCNRGHDLLIGQADIIFAVIGSGHVEQGIFLANS